MNFTTVQVDAEQLKEDKFCWYDQLEPEFPVYITYLEGQKVFKISQDYFFGYLNIEDHFDIFHKYLYPLVRSNNMISASITKEDFFSKFGQESNKYTKNHFYRWVYCCKDAFYLKVLYENFERNIKIVYFDTEGNVLGNILTLVDDEDIGSFAYDTYICPQLGDY